MNDRARQEIRSACAILRVPLDANADQILKAYRKLALKVHPDHNRAPDAQRQFRELHKARDTLLKYIAQSANLRSAFEDIDDAARRAWKQSSTQPKGNRQPPKPPPQSRRPSGPANQPKQRPRSGRSMNPLKSLACIIIIALIGAAIGYAVSSYSNGGLSRIAELIEGEGPGESNGLPLPTPTPTDVLTPTPAIAAEPTPTDVPTPTPVIATEPQPASHPRPWALYVVIATTRNEVDAHYVDEHGLRFEYDATQLAIGDIPDDALFAAIIQPSEFPRLTRIDARNGLIRSGSWEYSPAFITLDGSVYDAWVLKSGGLVNVLRNGQIELGRSTAIPTPTPTPVATATPSPTPAPTATPTSTPTATPPSAPVLRHLEAKRYMLELINVERVKAGVNQVVLGDNVAAQLHAESSLANCISSHWGSDGLKPYMRYSLAGGYQSNGENVSGLDYCIKSSDGYRAQGSIESEIREAMNGLMGSPGHRRNILDPWHRKVNIGLAWDRYNSFLVQHFEGGYVEYSRLPEITHGHLAFEGRTSNGLRYSDKEQLGLQLHYDPPPHELTRGQTSRTYCYDSGLRIAAFRYPLTGGWTWNENEYTDTHSPCPSPYDVSPQAAGPRSHDEAQRFWQQAYAASTTISAQTVRVPWITASTWTAQGTTFAVTADVGGLLSTHGPGVYTVLLWGEIGGEDVLVSQYSIWHEAHPPDTYYPTQPD